MKKLLLLLGIACVSMAGCAKNNDNNNNNNGVVICTELWDCQNVPPGGLVCCATESSPVIEGQVQGICAANSECCNCFGDGYCERCDLTSEICQRGTDNQGHCVPASCTAPNCSSNDDCSGGDVCCTNVQDGCENCGGVCYDPTAPECSTTGWECDDSPYAAAGTPAALPGGFRRTHKLIPLPELASGHDATLTATFRWQHDAGRPPPHDLAVGALGHDTPLFQTFSRNGRRFARVGLTVVPLRAKTSYELRLSLRSTAGVVTAHAMIRHAANGRAVLNASQRLPAGITALWREQLEPASTQVGPRVTLMSFGLQADGWSTGQSLAQFECAPAESNLDSRG